jgi:Calcium binding
MYKFNKISADAIEKWLPQGSIKADKSDMQLERIIAIIQDKNLDVNRKTLQLYWDFLAENLEMPCLLTGAEDYAYVIGGKKRKKESVHSTDIFELMEFEPIDQCSNLFVVVERVSDQKCFSLQLFDFESVKRGSHNDQILKDYRFWITNYL